MKKVFLVFTVIFTVLSMSESYAAKPLKITRSGSANGNTYDYVKQDPGFFVDKLNCRKPGAIQCAWVTHGGEHDILIAQTCAELHSLVGPDILAGGTSGTVAGDGYVATWTGSINEYGFADYEINVQFEED